MNWFDIFIAITLIRTSYIGFKNGLSIEIYKLLGFSISGLIAYYFYKRLSFVLSQYTITAGLTEAQLRAAVFVILFLAGIFIFRFIFRFLYKIMQLVFVKNFDSVFGMLAGLFRGVLVACLTFVILNWSNVDYIRESVQSQSLSAPYIIQINGQLKTILASLAPAEK